MGQTSAHKRVASLRINQSKPSLAPTTKLCLADGRFHVVDPSGFLGQKIEDVRRLLLLQAYASGCIIYGRLEQTQSHVTSAQLL